MASNVTNAAAREHPLQMVHYLRREVNFNTNGIADGVAINAKLPAGAEILFTQVKIKTAFNAASTNVLTVGTNASSYNDLINSTDVDEGSTGGTVSYRGMDVTVTNPTSVFIKYTQSGTAATTGKAVVIVAFIPNNDE